MKIEYFSEWNETVFDEIRLFKESLQKDIPTYFPEKIEDYKKFFHPESPFMIDHKWQGFQVRDGERLLGTCILCWKDGGVVGNLGFIDWINDVSVAKILADGVQSFAKEKNLHQLKTPVDLNFFIKYRIKLPGGGAPYFGEPIYPDYYHDLFKATGFEVIGTWDTYVANRIKTYADFFKKRKKTKKKKFQSVGKVTVRFIRLKEWDKEMETVYRLFLKSFSEMAEYEPITFEQFKLVYDDFKYIVHPLLSYIVELDGYPIGFSINYPDPLEVLSKYKGKELKTWQKVLLLAKLRLNFKTLLMPYMGKTPGPNGEDVKGVFLKITKYLACGVTIAGKSLICYQSPDSPSRRPLNPELVKEYAKYVLYGMDL